jgi:hypothetical protein
VAELTARRKADRAAMAAEVAGQAEQYGLAARVKTPGLFGERSIDVEISGPHTLAVTVTFDGSRNDRADTYVLSWHMRPWDAEGQGWQLAPHAFCDVNRFHGTKATDVVHGFGQLGRVLTLRFRAIADGTAFTREHPVTVDFMTS